MKKSADALFLYIPCCYALADEELKGFGGRKPETEKLIEGGYDIRVVDFADGNVVSLIGFFVVFCGCFKLCI